MKRLPRIISDEPVIYGVLKITWGDACGGLINPRSAIACDRAFAPLQDLEYFEAVKVAMYGYSIFCVQEDNEDVDLGSDRLREMAQEQAATSKPG